MKKYVSYFVFFLLHVFLFASCNDNKKGDANPKKKNNNERVKKNKMIGKWGGLGEATPVWDIREDSIYYFQHSKAYKYELIDKDMVVNFENYRPVFKNIHVVNDTLFFIDDIGISVRVFRFK